MSTKLRVAEDKRVIVSRNDRFGGLLTPGVYRIAPPPAGPIGLETHEISAFTFKSKWARFLIERRPDLVMRHFVLVETGPLDVAMVLANDSLLEVLLPQKKQLYWRDAGKISFEVINIGDEAEGSESEEIVASQRVEELDNDWVHELAEEC